ncbi:non-ribosomal peptide synthetase [Candidatus Methylobacter oryzae]|uniref:Amino acid adenylation domain-containing protein n=1 Tax=Candidatus Methylobacter oryzae TaxID=2497749 RepID=A0ABY3C5Q7_9GAMM|nr:non-ribosomal peptide synthetase [Candidatus Methylobacter oryzae]TRW90361.1 amino acid adenylation domain-containing protein [Candidatus Methylobacter oryzae]
MTDLNKANLQDIYPLSPMQQGMLFHALYQPGGDAYFEQISYDIRGDLDIGLFKQSWQLLHNRHDALRTVFVYKKTAKLLQMVLKHRDMDFNCIDLANLAPDQQAERIEQYRQQDRARGFVLTKERLSRIQLFKTAADRYAMIWSFHHIILDAWCFGIIYRELMHCYQSLLYNKPLRLAPAPPYSRYIQWLGAQDKDAAHDFWQNYLQGYDVAVGLYGQQQQTGDYCYAIQKLSLSTEDSDRLRGAARTAQVTLNTAVQAAWALLLSAHNSRKDIIFGVTVSGRPAAVVNVENTVGLFINTVPLRVRIDDRLSLSALLQHVQKQALSAESYHYYSLADIQSLCELKQNLLNHVLVFENIPQVHAEDSGMQNNGFAIRQTDMFEHSHYPFALSVTPDESIELTLTYDRSVYSDIKIERVAKQLEYLLLQIAKQPQASVAELAILPESQQAEILNRFSKVVAGEDSRLLLDLFARQRNCFPDDPAVSSGNNQLTFRELDARSNRFANYLLQNFQLEADDRVAVLLPRNSDLTVALLGILKTGAAYVPLDNAYPKARIDYILEHSQAKLFVTAGSGVGWGVPSVTVEQAVSQCANDSNPGINISPTQLAYLIYTSGSSGQPKGVMVEHANLAAFCINLRQRFGFTGQDKLLALTTISFDISVLELLCSLAVGIRIVIADDQQSQNPEQVVRLIKDHAITLLQSTPSRLQWLIGAGGIEALSALKVILVGGEALPESLAKQLKQLQSTLIINVYGPTEATIWSTCQPLGEGSISIGTALAGESVYIMSPERKLQPIGVIGEIVIAGAGVSRGYWQDEERTDKVFTSDPFKTGQRMYATGDLGRWLENGEIEFLGRNDDQVKIRGYRIELGEIERQILEHPAVVRAVVVNSGSAEQGVLNGFIVPVSPGGSFEGLTAELRKHLAQWLPEFMIPSRFIVTEYVPLNSNGKVDRKALVKMLGELAVPQRQYRAARNELEQQSVEIWQQVLQYRPIGIDDDFFSLGGNSITAIQLLSQLSKLFGKDILLSDFWSHSSISSLTEALADERNSVMVALNNHSDAPVMFCFPPITGFGAVFRGLAGYLSWSCYSFDIVPDIDWIAYSIAAIKQVQAHGPYVLLGYSAGGNYAYHVAAALQSQGEQVRALILIDSIRVTDIVIFSSREKQDVIEQALQESQLLATLDKTELSGLSAQTELMPSGYKAELSSVSAQTKLMPSGYKERVCSMMTAYLDFILQHPNRSALTTDLFCLNAEDRDGLLLPSDSFSRDWSASTLGTVINYQGKGNHFQVLAQPQLAHNAEVIQNILNKL